MSTEPYGRRAFLKAGSLSIFGSLGWGEALRLRAQGGASKTKRDISVIHVLLSGGMSHVDTLDMKPESRSAFRSIFKPIATNVAGIQICDRLPLLARQADKYTLIRSATHRHSVHEKASYIVISGHEPLPTVNHPSLGSVISRELGARNELPPYISIPAMTGQWDGSGILSGKYGPFETGDPSKPDFSVRDIKLPMDVDWARMERRRSLVALVDSQFREHDASGVFETADSFYQTAYDLVRSPAAKKAFALEQEPEPLREKYGRTPLGQGCLLARRLIEAGVRFITLSNGHYKWDHHSKVFENLGDKYLPELDRALAALLEDLQARGMLETTLVIATGEFGRTPEINVNAGRDHWPNVFTILAAGGGVPGGQVWGASDADGMQVRDNPVAIPDLAATVLAKVGVDYGKEYLTPIGRPFKLSEGAPLKFL
ncbi:MAG: DUF1501 domain-containing protein [Acidobacteria bacterium]|nr:DUF1501 domain-containing protein [Acidobacteriota bacterium]